MTHWRRLSGTNHRIGMRGEVCLLVDHFTDKPHHARCRWWGDRRAKRCTCGKLSWSVEENVITDAGLQYYAEVAEIGIKGSGSPTVTFARLSIATACSPSPSSTSEFDDLTIPSGGTAAYDSGYPQTDDPDTDNPGTVDVFVLSYRATFGVGSGTGTISHIAIHENGASGSDPLLSVGALGSPETKSAAQSAKAWANHIFAAP